MPTPNVIPQYLSSRPFAAHVHAVAADIVFYKQLTAIIGRPPTLEPRDEDEAREYQAWLGREFARVAAAIAPVAVYRAALIAQGPEEATLEELISFIVSFINRSVVEELDAVCAKPRRKLPKLLQLKLFAGLEDRLGRRYPGPARGKRRGSRHVPAESPLADRIWFRAIEDLGSIVGALASRLPPTESSAARGKRLDSTLLALADRLLDRIERGRDG